MLEINKTQDQFLLDYTKEDKRIAEEASALVREFHRTLSVVSGVMAAGIVLGSGSLGELPLPLRLALVCFVLSLAFGLVFLHCLFLSHRQHQIRLKTQTEKVMNRLKNAEETGPQGMRVVSEPLDQSIGHSPVPTSRSTNLMRVAQIVAVAAGFGLVFWGFGTGFFPDTGLPLELPN
ncbi:MAG: hypothetical protein OXH70_01955 [Acidobacteria bacterium]|nr:hypothetical protein [Acidobacteriota bacterium]MCY3971607.1 hypothetical protein [Acidobacteriota bacterium]